MNETLRLDVVDPIEIAELLEYLMERLTHAKKDSDGVGGNDYATYSLDDLREDVVRLTNKLFTSPYEKWVIRQLRG